MAVTGVYQIVYVDDMARATRFYTDAFGFEVAYGSDDWTSLTLVGAAVGLHGGRGGTDRRAIGLGVDVDDIDAACAAAVNAGGVISLDPEPRDGEPIVLAKVVDTEGNEFSVSMDKPDRVRP